MDRVNIELFGKDLKIKKMLGYAQSLSVSKAPVLVTGERGLGKKTLCRYIHQLSSRNENPFMVVDCSEDAQQVENSFLGYRDEYTDRFVKGCLEHANGGTLLMDNVDCMDESFQRKIFQIINELGDYDIDIRIMATTSKNLSKLVGAGRFYRGLYTYISANSLSIVPLRERVNDLIELATYFAQMYAGREISFADNARKKILSHFWAQNLEELKKVMEISVSEVESDVLDEDDLVIGEKKVSLETMDESNDGISLMSLKDAEKLLIKKALIHTSENRTQAARILGVSIRTLRNKINEYRNDGSAYFVNLR